MRKTLISLTGVLLLLGTVVPGAMAFSKDSLTYQKCTSCHAVQDGKISRVEEIRATPDEWGVIIDRMARLHGMDLNGQERHILLKEICETQILSPEELDQVSYLNLNNNPQTVEVPQNEEQGQLFATCVRCHSAGKIFSYRMTESAWAKIRDFHYYVDPAIDGQMREMRWYEEAGTMLAALAESLPYDKRWEAPKVNLAGSWVILGNEPGKGNYRGHASIKAGENGDYVVAGTLNFDDGTSESFQGDAVLYGGHALRTQTRHNNSLTIGAYSFTKGVIHGQHHFPAPDFRTSTSTWYPANGPAQLLKVTPSYLLAGETTTLTLEGVKLPAVKAGDLKFNGGNVKVLGAKRVGETIIAEVVYQGTGVARASLGVKNLGTVPVTLANQIDYIRITPELGRARVYGGIHYPAEGVQFEAIAFASGADNSDDLVLGPVAAKFKLSEKVTREGDDDLTWLGGIGANGTYIPTSDYGQILTREYKTEGTGLVKVEAEYIRGDRNYAAEAMLAVVPPDYVQRIK
jgi:quinohemoprotein amine dehydrogenase